MLRKLLALTALLLLPSTAFAGYAAIATASCTKNADGSGSCSGTLAAFRAAPDSSSWAYFMWAGNGALFSASAGGTGGFCSPDATRLQMWPSLVTMPSSAYFIVSWDSNRVCNNAQVYNTSYY